MKACCDVSWTDALTAIGTVGAVAVALFGQFLPRLFPPRLRVSMVNPHGVHQRVRLVVDTGGAIPVARDVWARYYHLEVRNARRWAKAHNVRLMLLKIERETTVGWVDVWSGGGIPFQWQHHEVLGSVRTLGPAPLADLFNVLQDEDTTRTKYLTLTTIFGPLGVELRHTAACALRLTVHAEGDEADSPQLVVTIRWDGQWDDGTVEMGQHLRWEATAV